MTLPFDPRTLTWKTDGNGHAKPLFNIANNVHQIRSKEVLCDYLHWAAGYPVKKTWLQAIKNGFFATWPGSQISIEIPPCRYRRDSSRTFTSRQQGIRGTKNTIELIEPELPGQGSLKPNQEEQVSVHLVT